MLLPFDFAEVGGHEDAVAAEIGRDGDGRNRLGPGEVIHELGEIRHRDHVHVRDEDGAVALGARTPSWAAPRGLPAGRLGRVSGVDRLPVGVALPQAHHLSAAQVNGGVDDKLNVHRVRISPIT